MRLNTALLSPLLLASLALTKPLSPSWTSSNKLATPSESDSVDGVKVEDAQPWQVFSLLKKPFDDSPLLSFIFRDPNTKYETNCKANLPMGGYVMCEDGNVMFLYGGMSYQYGETWLTITRKNIEVCDEPDRSTNGSSTDSNDDNCALMSASGTATLPHHLWQQPGWNSWVHPETLEVRWDFQ